MTDANQKMDLVRRQSCFAPLTDEEINELSELLTEETFPTGATIVKEGDKVDSVYLIVTGTAEVQRNKVINNPAEKEYVASLNPGDAIGLNETGFFSLTGLRTATVVATSDVRLLRLSVAAFHGFSLSHTHVTEVMHRHEESNPTLKQ